MKFNSTLSFFSSYRKKYKYYITYEYASNHEANR